MEYICFPYGFRRGKCSSWISRISLSESDRQTTLPSVRSRVRDKLTGTNCADLQLVIGEQRNMAQPQANLTNLFSDLHRFGQNEEWDRALKTANKSKNHYTIFLKPHMAIFVLTRSLNFKPDGHVSIYPYREHIGNMFHPLSADWAWHSLHFIFWLCQNGQTLRYLNIWIFSVLQETPGDEKVLQCKIVCFIQQGKFEEALSVIHKNGELSRRVWVIKSFSCKFSMVNVQSF